MTELIHDIKDTWAKVFVTKNVYELIRYIDGRKDDVRILYDVKAKLYFYALAGFTVHPEFIYLGWKNGLYPDLKNEYQVRSDYSVKNEFIYLYYYKDKPIMENLTGDYGMHYFYDFGIIDSKDILASTKARFEDTSLYEILLPRLIDVKKEFTRHRNKVTNSYIIPKYNILNKDF